jgi:hypothetical protein
MPLGQLSVKQPETKRSGNTFQHTERLRIIVAIDIGDDIAGPFVGLQVLAQDVQSGRRKLAVQLGHHARLISVDVQDAMPARNVGQL